MLWFTKVPRSQVPPSPELQPKPCLISLGSMVSQHCGHRGENHLVLRGVLCITGC